MWDLSLRAPRPELQAVHLSIAEQLRLMGQDFRVRGAAIAALVAIGSGAVPDLLGALEDRRAEVRLSAAEVLGRFAADGERIVPALARVVKGDAEPMVREAAIHSLETLGRYDRALVSALRDPDAGVRIAAALALERTGGCGKWEAVIALVETLDDVDAR